MISLYQARDSFAELDTFGDDTARREAWNNYTDSLTKDGELSPLQYHYAPAVDEAMPGEGTCYDALSDDREYILDQMGVEITFQRTDDPGLWEGGDPKASHWIVRLERGSHVYETEYHMGRDGGEPELCDVIYSLLADASMADEYDDIDEFAENLGIVKPSVAIKAWKACQRTAKALEKMFPELDDLRELFEGY